MIEALFVSLFINVVLLFFVTQFIPYYKETERLRLETRENALKVCDYRDKVLKELGDAYNHNSQMVASSIGTPYFKQILTLHQDVYAQAMDLFQSITYECCMENVDRLDELFNQEVMAKIGYRIDPKILFATNFTKPVDNVH